MKRYLYSAFVLSMLAILYSFVWHKPISPSKQSDLARSETKSDPFFIVVSDIHLNLCRDTHNPDGDADTKTWASTKNELEVLLEKHPAFVLFTGDLPAHQKDIKNSCVADKKTVDYYRRKDYDTILQNFYDLLKQRNIPFFYVSGNNDVVTGDYCAFTINQENVFTDVKASYPYPVLNTGRDKGHYPYLDSLNSEDCYYSACIKENLRLIVLNSNIFCDNEANTYSQAAGNKQLVWLSQQLIKAKKNNQNVYIATHMPPGENHSKTKMWKDPFLRGFLLLNTQYHDRIKGIFYGHVHTDEFRFLYDKKNENIQNVAFSCPSITSFKHGNNPGLKMFYFDQATSGITDIMTYYRSIDSTNSQWQHYNYSQIFGVPAGLEFTKNLMQKGGSDFKNLTNTARSIYFVKHNADKKNEDFPDPEVMKVTWK